MGRTAHIRPYTAYTAVYGPYSARGPVVPAGMLPPATCSLAESVTCGSEMLLRNISLPHVTALSAPRRSGIRVLAQDPNIGLNIGLIRPIFRRIFGPNPGYAPREAASMLPPATCLAECCDTC